MALATQCPHCLTIFRVASDQLKLRGGLVRCGSCRQVFNGNEFLVEPSIADGHYQPAPGSKAKAGMLAPPLAASAAAAATTATAATAAAPVTAAAAAGRTAPPTAPGNAATTASGPSASSAPSTRNPASAAAVQSAAPLTQPAPAVPATPASEPAAVPPAEAIPLIAEPKVFRSPASPGYIPDLGAPLRSAEPVDKDKSDIPLTVFGEDIDSAALLRRSSVEADDLAAPPEVAAVFRIDDDPAMVPAGEEDARTTEEDEPAAASEPDDEPGFVRRAERKARISHAMKMVMMVLAGVMVPLLLLQSLYYWRNPLAAAVPQVRPMLNGMCVALHCTVGLPAEIDRLSLESNELQVVPPNQNVYALTLVMRNRSPGAQAWPHIELTLNNDDEKAVVRRVFRPRDYLSDPRLIESGLGAESEQQIKLNFELKDALVSGYRIYLFYP